MIDYQTEKAREELRILKNILTDNSIASEFTSVFNEKVFSEEIQSFAQLVLQYFKFYKTAPTQRVLVEYAPERQELINRIYTELNQIEVQSQEYRYDLECLKNRVIQQKLLELKASLEDQDYFNLKQLTKISQEINDIQQSEKKPFIQKSLKTFSPDFKLQYAEKLKNPMVDRGILTHYSFLDYIKNGLRPGELLIIGADTGVGKSLLLNNMAIQMWLQGNKLTDTEFMPGHNVLYFSLEMPFEDCFKRTIARLSEVQQYHLRDGKLNTQEFQSLNEAIDFIERYPYEFEIVDIARGANIKTIEERFLEARKRFNPEIVVIDYLGLMSEDSGLEDWLALGKVAENIHEFARYYNIVVLTAVQLNRPAQGIKKDSGDLIGLHRIGRSAMIMHNANIALQIENRRDENTYADMIIHIIKNRSGQLGKFSLAKNLSTGCIKDIPYEPPENFGWGSPDQEEDISQLLQKYQWGVDG